jgi:hypothetical protein
MLLQRYNFLWITIMYDNLASRTFASARGLAINFYRVGLHSQNIFFMNGQYLFGEIPFMAFEIAV